MPDIIEMEVVPMPFEDFTKRGGRARFGFGAVTVMRSGGISLNKEAYEQTGHPAKIVLAFDRANRRIEIGRADESEEFAYPVRQTSPDSWWIPGRSFLRYYDILSSTTAKYRAEMDGRYLTVNLNGIPVHQERRAARKEDLLNKASKE
jgi:hypothetical protein